jgi:hypothetical protein
MKKIQLKFIKSHEISNRIKQKYIDVRSQKISEIKIISIDSRAELRKISVQDLTGFYRYNIK